MLLKRRARPYQFLAAVAARIDIDKRLREQAAGVNHSTGRTGAVTLIQRFGSALNLKMHA